MSTEHEALQAYAREIAEKLNETGETPLRQIELLIQHAGQAVIKEVLDQTLDIESKGGLTTEDGSRRRTIGGVFFYLAKSKLTPDVRQMIFPNFGQQRKGRVIEWADRHEHVAAMRGEKIGGVRYASITLQGLPGHIIAVDNSIMTTMTYNLTPTPLPKGVPMPPEQQIVYTVYMGAKQWEEAAEALSQNRNDRLVVEGMIFFDKETDTLAVLAHRVTTRKLEKRHRRDQIDLAEAAEASGETKPAPSKPQPKSEAKPQKPKENRPPKSGKPSRPDRRQESASSRPAPVMEVADASAPTSTEPVSKLQQLYDAANTLRERIASIEAKGGAGLAMTRKLLQNTEKQIEVLEKQSTQ